MNETQKGLIEIHGLNRRYGNLKSQCSLSLSSNSSTLNPHYTLRKEFLENAAVFCCVGSVGNKVAAFASLAPDKHEYLVTKSERSDPIEKELEAVLEAVHFWAADYFNRQKVILVTTNDEVYALLEHHQKPRNDARMDLMQSIQKEMSKYGTLLMVFSVSDLCIIRLICKGDDENIEAFVQDIMGNNNASVKRVLSEGKCNKCGSAVKKNEEKIHEEEKEDTDVI